MIFMILDWGKEQKSSTDVLILRKESLPSLKLRGEAVKVQLDLQV